MFRAKSLSTCAYRFVACAVLMYYELGVVYRDRTLSSLIEFSIAFFGRIDL